MAINWDKTLNVLAFGADPSGVNDSTAAFNNCIAALGGPGAIFVPEGTYITSGTILINSDNIHIFGEGFNSIIKPISGSNFDVISTPIPASAGLSGYVINYMELDHLLIDCSNMSGTVAGQGNGIHTYGCRYSFIHEVFIKSCKNWAILLDGDNTGPGNNFGYDVRLWGNIFDLCSANVYMTNCEQNMFLNNQFKWCGGTTSAAQPALGVQDTSGNHLRMGSGYAYIAGNVFGNGGTYTSPAILCSNSGPCRIIGNRFDQVRKQAVTLNGGNHMFAFNQLGTLVSVAGATPGIQVGSSNNVIIGNKFDNTAGAVGYNYAIAEIGGPFSNNIISGNNLLTGSSGFISLNATSTDRVFGNSGYNPVGNVTAPAIPASTTAYTNNFGVDATVHIIGGTVTVIAIGGVATGLTNSAAGVTVRVPAGSTITLTYSVVPTSWSWFLD